MRYLKLFTKLVLLLALPIFLQIGTVSVLSLFSPIDQNEYSLMALLLVTNILTILILFGVTKFYRQSIIMDYRIFPITLAQLTLAIGIGFTAIFVSLGISGFFQLQNLDPEAATSLEALTQSPFILSLLVVGIVAPIGEELIFRGAILRILSKEMPLKFAILLQALLFGIYHMNLVQAPPTAVLGVFLGVVVAYTHSIWPAIAIHIVNNSLAIVLSQFSQTISTDVQNVQQPSPIYYLVIGSFAFLLVLAQLKKLKSLQTSDPLTPEIHPSEML